MPKMHTVAHFELDLPGASPAEMKEAEALMRDPDYVAAVTETVNAIAGLQAKKAGMLHSIHITGSIASVAHSA
jgi:hypothetical protein